MNIAVAFSRAGVVLGATFAMRLISRWRVHRRQRFEMTTPLFDAVLLEAALAPRAQEGDDADLLAEIRDTLAHLNRRAYAEEFWALHTQLATLTQTLGDPQRATMQRAMLRLLAVDDRWLRLVAAKTCAALRVREAIAPLRKLLDGSLPLDLSSKSEQSGVEQAERRYRQELQAALASLEENSQSPLAEARSQDASVP